MNVLSLFSGIGGLELGLERAGMTTVGQVEINEFNRGVLATHWPEVPKHDDVRTCVDWWRGVPRPAVHLVCGGFPCQPFSLAGGRRGVADERWGWPWYFDVVRALRPRYVVVENVPALLRHADAFGWILADLASLGYDAEWDCIPAAAVGAHHRRDRLFLVAYADSLAGRLQPVAESGRGGPVVAGLDGAARLVADSPSDGWRAGRPGRPAGDDSDRDAVAPTGLEGPKVFRAGPERGEWPAEPDVGRVVDGVSGRVDRLRGLGNAVVPQVSEYVGRLVMAHAEVAA